MAEQVPRRVGPAPAPAPRPNSPEDRLDSWKEIATYLGRAVRTVQQWERSEKLPVHRLQHSKYGSVYAFRSELDIWRSERTTLSSLAEIAVPELARSRRIQWTTAAALVVAVIGAAGARLALRRHRPAIPARVVYTQLTNFADSATSPALSPDGRMLAFIRANSLSAVQARFMSSFYPMGSRFNSRMTTCSRGGARNSHWTVPALHMLF